MPGKKDFVSVRQEGKRVHVQKKLVLCNLKEAYHAFKDANPGLKIGFSKFAELRPPQCVLAGASGTHSVCVCTIHQNVKLMFSGARISELVGTNGNSFPSYHHCLARILCNPPLPACHLGDCSYCPGISSFRDDLIALLDESLIDNITFKQWVSLIGALSKPTQSRSKNLWTFSVRNWMFYDHMLLSPLNKHHFIKIANRLYFWRSTSCC